MMSTLTQLPMMIVSQQSILIPPARMELNLYLPKQSRSIYPLCLVKTLQLIIQLQAQPQALELITP